MYTILTDIEVETILETIPADVFSEMRERYNVQRVRSPSPMKLTLAQWAAFWWASGHWFERGRSRGCYQMCRKGDEGAYEMGNVRIDTKESNAAEQKVTDKQRMAGYKTGKANSKPVIGTCVKTGAEYEFPSVVEAATQLKCLSTNISSALNGRLNTSGGYRWRFK